MAFGRHGLRRKRPAHWGRSAPSKSTARKSPSRAEGSRPRSARASGLGLDAEHGAGIRQACQPCLRTPISYVPGLNKSEAIQTWGLRLRLRLDRFAVARDDDRNRIHLRTTQGGRGGATVLYCSSAALPGPEFRDGTLSPPDRSDRSRGRRCPDHARRNRRVGAARGGGAHGGAGERRLLRHDRRRRARTQALEEARAALAAGRGPARRRSVARRLEKHAAPTPKTCRKTALKSPTRHVYAFRYWMTRPESRRPYKRFSRSNGQKTPIF